MKLLNWWYFLYWLTLFLRWLTKISNNSLEYSSLCFTIITISILNNWLNILFRLLFFIYKFFNLIFLLTFIVCILRNQFITFISRLSFKYIRKRTFTFINLWRFVPRPPRIFILFIITLLLLFIFFFHYFLFVLFLNSIIYFFRRILK